MRLIFIRGPCLGCGFPTRRWERPDRYRPGSSFDVPQATLDKGIKYVLACRDKNGRFHYMPNIPSADTATYAHTAAAISALNAVGFKGDEEVLEQGTVFV